MDLDITSGMRNEPPISTSSPRETMTSPPSASVFRASRTAAALLLTTIEAAVARAPSPADPSDSNLRNSRSTWTSRLPRCRSRCQTPGWNTRLKPPDMVQCGRCYGRSPEIGVQDDSGCVDHRTQRVTQRLPDLALDRAGDPGESKVHAGGIQPGSGYFGSQACQHSACRIRDRSLAIAGNDRGQLLALQQLIHRRKLAVKIGFGSNRHR